MRKSQRDIETITSPAEQPAVSGVRTVAIGERIEVSLDSLAGTMAIASAVLAPQEIPSLQPSERYAKLHELGRGGMGRVDVVFDRALGRPVACKTVLEGRSAALLVAEAQICAQLEHPSIVPLYDVGVDANGNIQYTMRVVDGRTMRDVLDDNEKEERPKLGLAKMLGILRQVCLAVDYAHSRGVIHRDLKPENIVIGGFGEVYVLDWGVAYLREDSDIARSTAPATTFSVAGSPGYMAPEQALGGTIDARTDVFALGVILYEILTGQRPFEDADLKSLLARTAKESFPPPSLGAPERDVPKSFDAVVRACLLRNPEDRPPSARHVSDAIDHYLDAERARAEREREADRYAKEGDTMLSLIEDLGREAQEIEATARAELLKLRPFDPADVKRPWWDQLDAARRMRAESASALARAEAAYARALGRVAEHEKARRGLAALHYAQFVEAEKSHRAEEMTHHLEIARMYDDGTLGLELSDEGELSVETTEPAQLSISKYELEGMLLRPSTPRPLGEAPLRGLRLSTGSYVVLVKAAGREIKYPLMIGRMKAHHLKLCVPPKGSIPEDFVFVPGGPFLAMPPRADSLKTCDIPDFAIGRFPVTLREYSEFLSSLSDSERQRRGSNRFGPSNRSDSGFIEAVGRRSTSLEKRLDIPAMTVNWYHAAAYAQWVSRHDDRTFRLPTDLEWEKAMRGADGRPYPMGPHLDPSFAKLRESRPQAAEPEPVGTFELDESPYGVRDLAGGVWDWTSTAGDDLGPLPTVSDEGNPDCDQRQAYVRGGNFAMLATAPMIRAPMKVSSASSGVGFRLALSLDGPTSSLTVEPLRRD